MSDDAGRPGLRQLLWIAAGVAALTLLVVAASWLFSPRPSPGDSTARSGPTVLKEEQVQKDTFSPESPGGRPAPAPQAPLPETQVQRAPAPSAEVPAAAPASPAPSAPAPGEEKSTRPETPPPPKAETAPKSAPAPAHGAYGVQVGAFTEQSKAKEIAARLESLHYQAAVLSKDGKFKVVAKGFPDRASAVKAQEALAKAGIKDPFVVPLE